MEEMMTNEVVNEVVDQQVVDASEVVNNAGNSGNGLAFGIGAAAGAAAVTIAMFAPKVCKWAKAKITTAKERRRAIKAAAMAVGNAYDNSKQVEIYETDPEEVVNEEQ